MAVKLNQPTIGEQYKHYTGIVYTFIGFVKAVELESSPDTIIVSNSLVALQDSATHIIVEPLSKLFSVIITDKGQPLYERC
jgi:hypothetical protein